MPLFKCEKCGCLENTSLVDYWSRVNWDMKLPLCSECLDGKWHGEFPKKTPKELNYILKGDGFYGPPDKLREV